MSRKRQLLVDAAIELFSKRGYHATGIDLIAQASKVSKKTMYNHFRSKEELILAALKQYDGVFRNEFMREVDKLGGSPYERLLNIFEVAHGWFSHRKFYGCMYINAIGEYSDPDTSIREVCKEFKRSMLSYIEELTAKAGVVEVAQVASSLALLLEGAIVTAQISGSPACAKTAKRAAKTILDQTSARQSEGLSTK